MPFSNYPFSFWGYFNQVNDLLFFQAIFDSWTVWNQVKAEKLAGSDKKKFLLIDLVPRVPSFYIWKKFRLKNRITTVHLLKCQQRVKLNCSMDKMNKLLQYYATLSNKILLSECSFTYLQWLLRTNLPR